MVTDGAPVDARWPRRAIGLLAAGAALVGLAIVALAAGSPDEGAPEGRWLPDGRVLVGVPGSVPVWSEIEPLPLDLGAMWPDGSGATLLAEAARDVAFVDR